MQYRMTRTPQSRKPESRMKKLLFIWIYSGA